MRILRYTSLAVLLFVVVLSVASAAGPHQPGPPPPFDPGSAVTNPAYPPVLDPVTGQPVGRVVCDSNWCVIVLPPGMTPDKFEDTYGPTNKFQGCWNSTGSICVVAPVSPAADQWLRDWANWIYEHHSNDLCLLFSMQCPIPFPPSLTNPPGTRTPPGTPPGNGVPTPTPPERGHISTPAPAATPMPPAPPPPPPNHGKRPPGSSAGCPNATVSRAWPQVRMVTGPMYPLVAGQDQLHVGVVFTTTITVPPVIYRYWWKGADYCKPVPDANQNGLPDRFGDCWTQIGNPPVKWPGDITHDSCHGKTITYKDPVASTGQLQMILADSSRSWIENDLAQRYPGVTVRMPEIRIPAHGRGWCRSDNACFFQSVVSAKPIDPGYYASTVTFYTQGTPVTRPLQLRKEKRQPVYLLETRIVK